MITFESALKVLKKYGYKSKDSQPYLYKNNKEIGINYSYIDEKYGITDRVISFRNDIDLDMFLKKYQWYKLNNKNKIDLIKFFVLFCNNIIIPSFIYRL